MNLRRHMSLAATAAKLRAAAAALVLLGVAGCGAAASPSGPAHTEKLRLSLDWTSYVAYHAPIILAEEKGIFAKHGLDVQDSFTGGSKDAALAVGTGQADMAWADLSTASVSMLSGLPLKAVATVQAKNASGLTVLEGTKLDTAQDAVGLRIGSTPGGSDSTLIGAFLKKNNIPQDKVTIVNLPANGKFTALMTGKVDAISGQLYFYISSVAAQGKTAHGLSYSDMGTDTLDHGFVASNDYISKHPDAIKNFLAAFQEGLKATVDDPAGACKIVSGRSNGSLSQQSCESQLKLWLPLATSPSAPNWGKNDLQKWQETVDILKTFGGATGSVAPAQMFTNDFIPGYTK